MPCRLFPLIVGDKVPKDFETWELYITLLQIYKLVNAPSISVDATYYLKSKITQHHQLFLNLFPEHHLIPKHHNIVHYPRLIRTLGPLTHYSCMRPEGKHKSFKHWAKICQNYKNIAKTLATKHQESQAFRILQKDEFDSRAVEIHQQVVTKVSTLENDDVICDVFECSPQTDIVVCGVVEMYGYKYRPNIMLISEWADELPCFVRIEQIFLMQSKLHFLVQPWTTHEFDDHYQAYIVSNDPVQSLELKQPDKIFDYRPVHVVQSYSSRDKQMVHSYSI